MFATAKKLLLVGGAFWLAGWLIGCSDSGGNPTQPNPTLQARWSGEDGIRALLQRRCSSCHPGQGQFDVSDYDEVRRRVQPGDPNGSLLVKRLEGTIQPQMPLGGTPLPPEQISVIRRWIADGAQPD